VNHVIVMPPVSRRLRELIHDREELIEVLTRLYDHLAYFADRYRDKRDAEEPDSLFDYSHSLFIGGRWKHFHFSVNDAQAEDYLFVEAVSVG